MEDENESIMYSVLEYAEHGSISNFVRFTGGIEERISKFFMLQICHAIEFIHQQGYAHLDVKLENILLDEFFNIKLADMGASLNVKESYGFTSKRRGTVFYMAPEVQHKPSEGCYNGLKSDIFSLGITLFVMLIGEFPNPNSLMNNSSTHDTVKSSKCFTKEEASFDALRKFEKLSPEVQELIKSMTDLDPANRPSI